jgi:hypothetical protein
MADAPGTIRRIAALQAEADRLAFGRQLTAGQICHEEDRRCDADCEIGPRHCANLHACLSSRGHDAAHCDRTWAAKEERDG